MTSGRKRCVGHNKVTGKPCGLWPIKGALVCHKHGGSAPQVKAAAARRQSELEMRRSLARLDADPVSDPFTALSKLAGEVLQWKDAWARRVNALAGDGCQECGGGAAGDLRYAAQGAGTEQLRSEVALFERAMDRCAAVLGLIAKLDIDSRMAAISERQAEAVLRAVDAALAHAGVAGPAAIESRGIAARELRRTG